MEHILLDILDTQIKDDGKNKMYTIKHLNLLTSSKCDLNCEYCFLTKNEKFNNYDKTIIHDWESGKYVKNIKKVFSVLNSDPKEVTEISFWGGEPFLNLKNIKNGIKELNQYFPNIEMYHVPTNWCHTNISDLCDLLKIINDTATPRSDNSLIHFHIQTSIDGVNNDIFMKSGHSGDWQLYKKNFDMLCDTLENMYLPNISIDFCVSSTGAQDLILEYFENDKNIQSHIEAWDKAVRYVQQKIKKHKNPDILFNTLINFPTVAIPQKSTVQDGLKLTAFLRKVNYYLYQKKAMYRQQDSFTRDYFNCESIYPIGFANHECPEADQHAVTLRSDGMICQCPNSFLETDIDYQQEILKTKGLLSYKQCLLSATNYFNPLTATEEDIKDHKWYTILGGYKDTVFPYIHLNFAFALELALSRQINYQYYQNPEQLLKHFTAGSMMDECFRNNILVSGTPYLTGQGMYRRWLNGWLEYSYQAHEIEIKNMMQYYLQEKTKESNKKNE